MPYTTHTKSACIVTHYALTFGFVVCNASCILYTYSTGFGIIPYDSRTFAYLRNVCDALVTFALRKNTIKGELGLSENPKNKVRGSFAAAPNLKLARGPEQRGYQARKPLATKAGFAI